MSHEFESGFFVAKPAWHRLGKVLQQPPSAKEAIAQAGLDWRVLEELVFPTETTATAAAEAGALPADAPVAIAKNLIRDRDGRLLGRVDPTYVPLQNQDAFRWFDPLVDSGQVTLDAAGSLQGGRRIWILARIANTEVTVGTAADRIRPYLLLHNAHDGSTSVWIQFTPIRVVCMNTLGAAARHRFGDIPQKKAICIPHTLTMQEQLTRIQGLVDMTKREFQVCHQEYEAIASQEVNHRGLAIYFARVMGSQVWQRSLLMQLVANFEQGRGNRGKTLWDAYNAVTEWLDYQQGTSAEERLQFSWFGNGAQLRQHAHQVALDLVGSPALALSSISSTSSTRSMSLSRRP